MKILKRCHSNVGVICMVDIKIKLDNNVKHVMQAEKEKKSQILYALGLKWQQLCTDIITQKGIVDSGRLRGSLTFITNDKIGKPITKVSDNKSSDFLTGSSGNENTLIVGSDVEYARRQEFENKKGSYLRTSLLDYRDSYELLAEQIWKQ